MAGLALAEQEETVVVTADVECGTGMHALADAQTVGQQLHRSDVVADVVDQSCSIGELIRTIVVVLAKVQFLFHRDHQDRVTLLIGGGHIASANVPTTADSAVVNVALAVAVLVIG